MCGFAGILGLTDHDTVELCEIAGKMAGTLHHRGPDASGRWGEDHIAFGHARLAILELGEAGLQPMHSACGRYVIAYNGEIYNHLDLRRQLELESAAPAWNGHSDTETLLAAIAYWGLDESLKRSRGMFALALWDREAERLSLARDRIGEKPLYWGFAEKCLVFGSELKALRIAPGFNRALSRDGVREYLRFGYVPAPLSIYASAFKLEPGAILQVEGREISELSIDAPRIGTGVGGLSIRTYWSLEEVYAQGAARPIQDEREAVDGLEEVLSDAVSRQMISDVPLGAFLSGGVDSSTIAALMQHRSSGKIQTFTIGFESSAFDESSHAEAVARHLGTDHHCHMVSANEARSVIPLLPELYDEPFADSSQIPTFLLCQMARKNVTVALSGDGGDELFGGYNRYIHGPILWRWISAIPAPVRHAIADAILALPIGVWDRLGDGLLRIQSSRRGTALLGTKAHRVGQRLNTVNSIDDLHRSMSSIIPDPSRLMGHRADQTVKLPFDGPVPDELANHPAARMMMRDIRSYLPDDILCKVDRAAMGVSLETRVPLLDPEVVAYAARLPIELKIHKGVGKYALRKVLCRHVPRELIERPKAGFSAPLGEWLRGPLREWADELLEPQRIEVDELLRAEPVRRLWHEHLSGHFDHSAQLWNVITLQAWREAQA